MQSRVAVLLFDKVEIMDFAGPYEVFGAAGQLTGELKYDIYNVAQSRRRVIAKSGLNIEPDYTFEECPIPDILVIPGGFGTRRERFNQKLLEFIRDKSEKAERVLSVCSGALLLAKAGLLDELEAVTHKGAIDDLRADAPRTVVNEDARFVDNGKFVVSAGVSAGIDASLYMVAQRNGDECAKLAAQYMEYEWTRN